MKEKYIETDIQLCMFYTVWTKIKYFTNHSINPIDAIIKLE